MVKHTKQENKNTSYFITFTCEKWLPLIEQANSYAAFYKWFDYLKENNYALIGYVIMPNHFHGIIHIPEHSDKSINEIVANGKRFISYDIIKRLKKNSEMNTLVNLEKAVSQVEWSKGQKHKVFKISFDCKEVLDFNMLRTKLDYMHKNPCQGKWDLTKDYREYKDSSAGYYELERENNWITNYVDLY